MRGTPQPDLGPRGTRGVAQNEPPGRAVRSARLAGPGVALLAGLALGLVAAAPAVADDTPTLVFTTLTDSPDPVLAGEQLTITVLITNTAADPGAGDNDSTGTILRSNLTGLSIGTTVGDTLPGTCAIAASILSCPLGTIDDANGTASGTITLNVLASAAAGALALDWDLYSTEIASPGVDGDTSTTVATEADLAVTLDGPAQAVPGTNLVYTVEVENLGPSDAQGVTLDLVPTSTLPAPSSVSGAGCVALPCALGTVAAGATPTVTVTYALPGDYHLDNGFGNIVNEAQVSTTTTDPVSANDEEGESTPVEPHTDLVVSISSAGANVTPGEIVFYTVTVTNDGPSSTDRVRLTGEPTVVPALPRLRRRRGHLQRDDNRRVANWTGLDLDDGESASSCSAPGSIRPTSIRSWRRPTSCSPRSGRGRESLHRPRPGRTARRTATRSTASPTSPSPRTTASAASRRTRRCPTRSASGTSDRATSSRPPSSTTSTPPARSPRRAGSARPAGR